MGIMPGLLSMASEESSDDEKAACMRFPRFPGHVSLPVLIGVGGVAFTSTDPNNDWEEDYFVEDSEAFLLIEPGVELEMNVTRFFRFSIGGYYRYTTELDLLNTKSDVLNGFSFGVNFKFGKF